MDFYFDKYVDLENIKLTDKDIKMVNKFRILNV